MYCNQLEKGKQGGQAIVLVTLALFAMCGMMGLAVDLGWSYYTVKSERVAADSAALGAIRAAFASGNCTAPGGGSCFSSPQAWTASSAGQACGASNTGPGDASLQLGCKYAA